MKVFYHGGMSEFLLYGFGESGNSYRCALMLAATGVEWTPRLVDFFNGETRSAPFRSQINDMGEVPVLEHEGQRLSQSGVILDYLAECTGRYGWTVEIERRQILRWILFDNQKLSNYISNHRSLTYFQNRADAAVDYAWAKARDALAIVDARLAAHDWIALDRPTIADFSIAGYMFYDGETGMDWRDWPALDRWRDRMRGLAGWQAPYDLLPPVRHQQKQTGG